MTSGPLWYQVYRPQPQARVRLYCLPCAGGGASMFRPWQDHLPDWVELRAIRLPGRQARHREASFEDCDTAAAALAGWLADEDTDYALFGHSMGAMLAYRATQLLLAGRSRAPELLVAASWPVHGVPPDTMPDPDATEPEFWAKVTTLGGSAPELLADPYVRALTLPVLLADFRLCHTYRYRSAPALPTPVAVYGGGQDTVTPPDTLPGWAGHSRRVLGPRLFPGGHFFVQDRVEDVTAAVVADLRSVLADRREQP